jgi:surfactin synthase thioesterase subunit
MNHLLNVGPAEWRPNPFPWLVPLTPSRPGCPRLICFHHAGGSPAAFREWPAALGGGVQLSAVHLPGRGRRFAESNATDFAALADAIASAVARDGVRPLLYGHSMGALLAYEVAWRLCAGEGPLPLHLIVAGAVPPDQFSTGGWPAVESDADLLRRLATLGGTPQAIIDNNDLMSIYLPILRADIALCASYCYCPGPALPCPITALGSADDPEATLAALAGWGQYTTAGFTLRLFPGGHFFPATQLADVSQEITAIVRRSHGPTPQRGPVGGVPAEGSNECLLHRRQT